MNFSVLSRYDDMLASYFVDSLYLWYDTLRMNSDFVATTMNKQETVQKLRDHIINASFSNKSVKDAVDSFLEMPYFSSFIKDMSNKEVNEFIQHMKRYLYMYRPNAGFEVGSTTRYTGKPEACLLATKDWTAGEQVTCCLGSIAELTEQDDLKLKSEGRDFSVMVSTRKKCSCLFLGPARFMNHDCDSNCEFILIGQNAITFRVQKDISVGEEMTVFYADHYFGENNCECLCSSCERNKQGHFSVPSSDDGQLTENVDPELAQDDTTTRRSRRKRKDISYKDYYVPEQVKKTRPITEILLIETTNKPLIMKKKELFWEEKKRANDVQPGKLLSIQLPNPRDTAQLTKDFSLLSMETISTDDLFDDWIDNLSELSDIDDNELIVVDDEEILDILNDGHSHVEESARSDIDVDTITEIDATVQTSNKVTVRTPFDVNYKQDISQRSITINQGTGEQSNDIAEQPIETTLKEECTIKCCPQAKEFCMTRVSENPDLCGRCNRHYQIYGFSWPVRKFRKPTWRSKNQKISLPQPILGIEDIEEPKAISRSNKTTSRSKRGPLKSRKGLSTSCADLSATSTDSNTKQTVQYPQIEYSLAGYPASNYPAMNSSSVSYSKTKSSVGICTISDCNIPNCNLPNCTMPDCSLPSCLIANSTTYPAEDYLKANYPKANDPTANYNCSNYPPINRYPVDDYAAPVDRPRSRTGAKRQAAPQPTIPNKRLAAKDSAGDQSNPIPHSYIDHLQTNIPSLKPSDNNYLQTFSPARNSSGLNAVQPDLYKTATKPRAANHNPHVPSGLGPAAKQFYANRLHDINLLNTVIPTIPFTRLSDGKKANQNIPTLQQLDNIQADTNTRSSDGNQTHYNTRALRQLASIKRGIHTSAIRSPDVKEMSYDIASLQQSENYKLDRNVPAIRPSDDNQVCCDFSALQELDTLLNKNISAIHPLDDKEMEYDIVSLQQPNNILLDTNGPYAPRTNRQSAKSASIKRPAAKKQSAKKHPAKRVPAKEEPATEEPVREESFKDEPAREEPTTKQPTQKQLAKRRSAKRPNKKRPAKGDIVKVGHAGNESAEEEPVMEEPPKNEPVKRELAKEVPAVKEIAMEEPAKEESANEESAMRKPVKKQAARKAVPAFKDPNKKKFNRQSEDSTNNVAQVIDLISVGFSPAKSSMAETAAKVDDIIPISFSPTIINLNEPPINKSKKNSSDEPVIIATFPPESSIPIIQHKVSNEQRQKERELATKSMDSNIQVTTRKANILSVEHEYLAQLKLRISQEVSTQADSHILPVTEPDDTANCLEHDEHIDTIERLEGFDFAEELRSPPKYPLPTSDTDAGSVPDVTNDEYSSTQNSPSDVSIDCHGDTVLEPAGKEFSFSVIDQDSSKPNSVDKILSDVLVDNASVADNSGFVSDAVNNACAVTYDACTVSDDVCTVSDDIDVALPGIHGVSVCSMVYTDSPVVAAEEEACSVVDMKENGSAVAVSGEKACPVMNFKEDIYVPADLREVCTISSIKKDSHVVTVVEEGSSTAVDAEEGNFSVIIKERSSAENVPKEDCSIVNIKDEDSSVVDIKMNNVSVVDIQEDDVSAMTIIEEAGSAVADIKDTDSSTMNAKEVEGSVVDIKEVEGSMVDIKETDSSTVNISGFVMNRDELAIDLDSSAMDIDSVVDISSVADMSSAMDIEHSSRRSSFPDDILNDCNEDIPMPVVIIKKESYLPDRMWSSDLCNAPFEAISTSDDRRRSMRQKAVTSPSRQDRYVQQMPMKVSFLLQPEPTPKTKFKRQKKVSKKTRKGCPIEPPSKEPFPPPPVKKVHRDAPPPRLLPVVVKEKCPVSNNIGPFVPIEPSNC